jgi:hypothetical protein
MHWKENEKLNVKCELKNLKYSENTTLGIRHADHVAPSISKSWN